MSQTNAQHARGREVSAPLRGAASAGLRHTALPALALSSGVPLAEDVRAPLESRFGRDFSAVRVHTDDSDADAARNLGARAFTVGRDIVFGEGEFAPHRARGQELLVHELAHVLQPGGEGHSAPGDASETEAARAARAFASGDRIDVDPVASGAIKREPDPQAKAGQSGDALIEQASPLLAGAIGSDTFDHFVTGQAVLTPQHLARLTILAHTIIVLLRTYPLSSLEVIGYTDTVGTEEDNLALGQDRADTVAAELAKLGIPAAIMSVSSRGEGAQQGGTTKDGVPSGQNRRVDVRFRPRASRLGPLAPSLRLQPPSREPIGPDKTKPPVDLTVKPKIVPAHPTPNIFKRLPPIKGTGPTTSFLELIGRGTDWGVDQILGGLPNDIRDPVKSMLRGAVKRGSAAGVRAAAEKAGITDPDALEAIEKLTEAAIQGEAEERVPENRAPEGPIEKERESEEDWLKRWLRMEAK